MNRFSVTLSILGVLLYGCGGSTDPSLNGSFPNSVTASTASANSVISGKVVDRNGAPQSGVRVVVQERTNDFRAIGTSAADGTFQFNVVAGVYDLGLDKEGDTNTATCYYGPVLPDAGSQTFVLQAAGGRTNERLFGKIWLQPGTPAGGRKLVLRPGFWTGAQDEHSVVNVNTESDGTFDTALKSGQQAGLDLEIYDSNGALGEFIDLDKLSKPCYVEFASQQTSTKNRLRANEADPAPEAGLAAAVNLVQFAVATVIKSKLEPPDNLLYANHAVLNFSNGVLPPDGQERALSELTQGSLIPPAAPKDATQTFSDILYLPTTVRINYGAWLWSPYTVIVYSLPGVWDFQDQSGKKLHLESNTAYQRGATYKATYTSPQPALQSIRYSRFYSQTLRPEGDTTP